MKFDLDWTEDDFVGGHVVLDFVNTAGGATKSRDLERLVDFHSAIGWALARELVTEDEHRQLSNLADADLSASKTALETLRSFREMLHMCLMAQQRGAAWPLQPRLAVEASIKTALLDANLKNGEESYCWVTSLERCGLELVLHRISLATEGLLRSDELPRLRNCERCSWLFIDRGRGRPRRWCSMAACGSRAKSARYYMRHKSHSDGHGD